MNGMFITTELLFLSLWVCGSLKVVNYRVIQKDVATIAQDLCKALCSEYVFINCVFVCLLSS